MYPTVSGILSELKLSNRTENAFYPAPRGFQKDISGSITENNP